MNVDERIITKQEERAFRLCHHDFDGLDIASAASKMRVSPGKIESLLRSIERKAPHLFPILSGRQKAIIALYDQGEGRKTVAQALSITLGLLNKEVDFLHKRGFITNKHVAGYNPIKHDHLVREKF